MLHSNQTQATHSNQTQATHSNQTQALHSNQTQATHVLHTLLSRCIIMVKRLNNKLYIIFLIITTAIQLKNKIKKTQKKYLNPNT